MPEPQETQQPQGLTQPSLNRYTVSDPNKATPLYVTGMTVSRRKDIRIVFLAFFSGYVHVKTSIGHNPKGLP
ncbi:hypothetical protein, partial [Thermus brockianus]